MIEQYELPLLDDEARTQNVVDRSNNKYLSKNFKISTSRTLDDPILQEVIKTPDINEASLNDYKAADVAENNLSVSQKLNQIRDNPIQSDHFNYSGAAKDTQKMADDLKRPYSDAQIVWDNIYTNMSPAEKKNFLADEKRKKILQDVEKFDSKALEDFNNRVEKFKNREYNNYQNRVNNYRIAKTNVLIEEKKKELGLIEPKPIKSNDPIVRIPEDTLDFKIRDIAFNNLLKKVEAERRERDLDLNNRGIAYVGLMRGYKVNL